jgi:hypothetical protein
MNARCVNCNPNNRRSEGLDLLLISIFKRALPVWQRYNGAVPPEALCQLDNEGDWPPGIAAATMQRLSRDPELRKSLAAFKWRIEYE